MVLPTVMGAAEGTVRKTGGIVRGASETKNGLGNEEGEDDGRIIVGTTDGNEDGFKLGKTDPLGDDDPDGIVLGKTE